MRRVRVVVAVLTLVVAATVAPVAARAVAAPPVPTLAVPPATWTNVSTPPLSGDTRDKVYTDTAVIPGAGVWTTGYTRHTVSTVFEVRTLVERNTGGGWTTVDTPDVETAPAADYMYGVSGTAANDVWIVGQSSAAPGTSRSVPYALHWNGTAWASAAVPDPSGGTGASMSGVVSLARNDVWAVGTAYPLEARGAAFHYDGRSWSSVRLPLPTGCKGTNFTELTGITATPAGDVYAAGDCPTKSGYGGFVIRMNTLASWTVVARVAGTSSISDLTTDADGTVWATGNQSSGGISRPFLLYGSGTTWTKQYRPVPTSPTVEQVHGVAVTPTGITLVGEVNVGNQRAPWAVTWTPSRRWQRIDLAPPETDATSWLGTVAGTAGGPVWAMGEYLGVVGGTLKMVGYAAHP